MFVQHPLLYHSLLNSTSPSPDLTISAHHLHQTYLSFTTLIMQHRITVPCPPHAPNPYSPALNARSCTEDCSAKSVCPPSTLAWLWDCGSCMPSLHSPRHRATRTGSPNVCPPHPDLAPQRPSSTYHLLLFSVKLRQGSVRHTAT
ncbi:hypothetical protein M3J09_000901 [Ascochyta lentis]